MLVITQFGKAIRKARIDAAVSLASMASELGTTSSFLSALEMGRKKIPSEWPKKIESYFHSKGVKVELEPLAYLANKTVPIDGLSPAQQLLVASVARADLDEEQVAQLAAIFDSRMR
ncbi:MAG: XRE family transcriptional regulator [Alcaligenaceae bacterium]|nr:MAG: XRE family transcriptional regulator [Alcaligenaceae bacterium]